MRTNAGDGSLHSLHLAGLVESISCSLEIFHFLASPGGCGLGHELALLSRVLCRAVVMLQKECHFRKDPANESVVPGWAPELVVALLE